MNGEKKLTWSPKSKEILCKTAVLTLNQIESVSPQGKTGRYIVMDAPEWGIVVPLLSRPDGNYFVMVKQWRHGSNSLSVEFPGGVLNTGENPEIGALRELEEETGYKAGKVTHLAVVNPNPALMSNRLHIFLAEDLQDTRCQKLDADEFVDVLLIEEQELYKKMGHEPYIHAFMSTALFLYSQHRKASSNKGKVNSTKEAHYGG